MSNYMPIEGRTMVLEADDSNAGFSGDSLDYGGGQNGDWRVYWYWDPSTSTGGITNISWPSDFNAYSEALDINSLLQEAGILILWQRNFMHVLADWHLWFQF